MFKLKKTISIVMSLVFTLTVLGFVPMSAKAKTNSFPTPVISGVGSIYNLGDTININVISTGYTKNVNYKVVVINNKTKKTFSVTKGYSTPISPKKKVVFKYKASAAGDYRITVYGIGSGIKSPKTTVANKTFKIVDKLALKRAAEAKLKAATDKKIADKKIADKKAADKALADKIAADKVAADKVAADKVEADKIAADKAAADKIVADKAAADKIAADKAAADKIAADKAAADKIAADKAAADKIAADKAAADKVAADKLIADAQAAAQQAAAQAAAQQAAAQQAAASARAASLKMIIDTITALPSIDAITFSDKAIIEAARAKVNTANANGIGNSEITNLQKLIDCEAKIKELEALIKMMSVNVNVQGSNVSVQVTNNVVKNDMITVVIYNKITNTVCNMASGLHSTDTITFNFQITNDGIYYAKVSSTAGEDLETNSFTITIVKL